MKEFSSFQDRLMAINVLVIGSLNVDWLFSYQKEPENGGSERILSLTTSLGGHAGNCSIALRRLNVNTWILGAIGDDQEGRLLLRDLDEHGIHTEHVSVVKSEATGKVLIPQSPQKQSMFMYRGANESTEILNLVKNINFESFSHIIVFDPIMQVIDYLISQNIKSKVLCFWNPGGILVKNPSIVNRLDLSNTVIFNESEFNCISAADSFEDRMEAIREADGSFKLIITQGDQGSTLYTKQKKVHIPAFKVDSVDPTGAGDCFTAGYGTMVALGESDEVCMRFGNLLGALATRKIGARTSMPYLAELEKYAKEIWGNCETI